ncbi:flagellar export protein FliJ [Pantoea sp. Tr-811]|uniref:flagellar export protein FliJ n=1 Tax=unclassified Pantoea TaxID=2630326 RepID=UPI001420D0C8|nr:MULTISPECIES: flagellar export protein FliJ [unclassified Pantoea]NIE75444.1 flagellar export protein FliJ [Pantoea sp. Ap-967]NIF26491.1 flagellar export protein FliJ [Pantoea sp. Tr-811]
MAHEPLHMLIELTDRAREAAATALAQSRRTEQQMTGQLRLLDQYQREYRQNLQGELVGAGMSPSTLANYRGFLKSLEGAIERAEASLARHRAQLAQHQEHWRQQWRKANALETLLARRREQARLQAGRAEQRRTDELAGRARSTIDIGF